MSAHAGEIQWLTIFALTGVTVLTRAFFFLSQRPWSLPRWAQRGLQYAPIAALSAVIAPEVLLRQGQVITTLADARLYGAAAGVAFFFAFRHSRHVVLGTICSGMLVYLPLHLLLGW